MWREAGETGSKSGGSTIKSRDVSEGYIENGTYETQMGRGEVETRISFYAQIN